MVAYPFLALSLFFVSCVLIKVLKETAKYLVVMKCLWEKWSKKQLWMHLYSLYITCSSFLLMALHYFPLPLTLILFCLHPTKAMKVNEWLQIRQPVSIIKEKKTYLEINGISEMGFAALRDLSSGVSWVLCVGSWKGKCSQCPGSVLPGSSGHWVLLAWEGVGSSLLPGAVTRICNCSMLS